MRGRTPFGAVCLWMLSVAAGCQAMAPHAGAPMETGSPLAANKEASPNADASDVTDVNDIKGLPPSGLPSAPPAANDPSTPASAGVSGGFPSGAHDLVAVADPQAGGVTALPADVEGNGDDVAFDFTLTGTAEPVCVEPMQDHVQYATLPTVRRRVKGTVGAVLLDGTPVPLSGCEVLTLRFRVGAMSGVCDDISLKADCSFNGTISLRKIEEAKVFLFTDYSQGKDPHFRECNDVEAVQYPAELQMAYLPAENQLSVCAPPTLNESILKNSRVKQEFLP